MIALYGIGKTYLRLSNFEKAQECGERILELDDREVNQAAAEILIGSALLGNALASQGEGGQPELLAEAESHLRASLDLSSGQMSIAWFNLSVALQEQDRLAEARDAQQKYVNRTPENRAAKVRLCRLQYLAESTSESPARSTTNQVDQPVAEEEPVSDVPALVEPERQTNPPQEPLKVGGDVLPPQSLHTPNPTYTKEARLARIQGVVILEAIIDKQGNVTAVKVLKGLPIGLSTSAALTACQWHFEPATLHGKPVPVYFNLTTRFSLQ